uniref:Uncharacterized protein n=1 Tax=Arundo donax TaxID=35708 RepID=A0A0A9C2B3_ARUDO
MSICNHLVIGKFLPTWDILFLKIPYSYDALYHYC